MSFFRRQMRLLFQIIGFLTVIGLLLAAIAVPLLPRLLQVQDKIEKADYILPLAGNWHRIIKAAELYNSGYAPKVVLSNSRIPPPSRFNKISKAIGVERPERREMRRRLLLHFGVPESAHLAFGEGHISTTEEAEAFRNFLAQRDKGLEDGKRQRIILVTSPYHTRRAKLIFEAAIPEAQFMMASPPEGRLKPQWWRHQKSAQLAVSEAFKFTFYLLGGRFSSSASQP